MRKRFWLDPDTLRRSLAFMIPTAVLLTVMAGLVYAAAQNVYRNSANDPQMQMATDAVLRLDRGAVPAEIASGGAIDLASSLNTHVTVYGPRGQVLASTAQLNGTVPLPPPGILTSVSRRDRTLHWVTWQPQPGVRVAAVVAGWRHGSVLLGRSLKPSEDRVATLEQLVGGVWLVGLVVLIVASYIAARIWPDDRVASTAPA